jgi:hypothetical protein
MRLMPFALCIAAACSACASDAPLTKAGTSAAEMEQDRQHCNGVMYSERSSRGRSAPHWGIYEHCMRARGYAREKPSG